MSSSRARALAGLAGALAISVLPIAEWIAPGDSAAVLLIHEAVWWTYAAAILLWLRLGERLPLSSIGLRPPKGKDLLYALVAAAVLFAVFIVHFSIIVPIFHLDATRATTERNSILARQFWYRLMLVTRASVVEEILFRGYLIEKVRQLTGSTLWAGVVSVAAFTYAHLSGWGAVHLIPVFAGAVTFAVLYVRRHNLPANMVAHFLVDGAGFLLG